MALKKKRIGELDGSPLVVGDANLVNEHEILIEMNGDNTYRDFQKRKNGDQFESIINNKVVNNKVELVDNMMKEPKLYGECLEVSDSFSDDLLLTLFPDEKALNGKTRREALVEQLSLFYTTDNDKKILDYSDIDTLGNASVMDFGTTTVTVNDGTIFVDLDSSVETSPIYGDNFFFVAIVNETKGAVFVPSVFEGVSANSYGASAPQDWEAADVLHAIPFITDAKTTPVGFGTISVIERPITETII